MRALILCSLVVAIAAPVQYVVKLDTSAAPLVAGARVGTYAQAARAFGKPSVVVVAPGGRALCIAKWRQMGLDIRFTSVATGRCRPSVLRSWSLVTMRTARWHTRAGLHAGDTDARLHVLYPDARRLDFLGEGPLWELETGGPLCDGGNPLAIAARTAPGHVVALLVVHVPACG